jgi:hypothetical protein
MFRKTVLLNKKQEKYKYLYIYLYSYSYLYIYICVCIKKMLTLDGKNFIFSRL